MQLTFWIVFSCIVSAYSAIVQVACVGDEFTLQYIPVLSEILGPSSNVTGFALESATVLRNGDAPFWNSNEFAALMNAHPDIVVLMFGTNDAKSQNWDAHNGEFGGNYRELIQKVVVLPSNPQVHLAIPPPLYKDGAYNIRQNVVNSQLPQLIGVISRDADLNTVIDVFHNMGGLGMTRPELFQEDGVHLNDSGNKALAQLVRSAILDDYEQKPRTSSIL